VCRSKQVNLFCLKDVLNMKFKSYGIITIPTNKSETAKLAIKTLIRVLNRLNLAMLNSISKFPNIIGSSILVACLPLFGWNSWYPGVPCDPMYIYSKSYSGLVYCILIGSMIANFAMYVQVVNTALYLK
jgi:hypothetical protein